MEVVMPRRKVMLLGLGACCLALGAGCAQWSAPPPAREVGALPRPMLAPDSVVFEVTFVHIPENEADFTARFWPEVDEAVLPTDLRRHLTANGVRCGLIGSPLPTALQEVLDLQPDMEAGGGAKIVDPGRQVVARTNRLSSRTGQVGKVLVRSNPIEKLAALTYHPDGEIRGDTLSQAQLLFSITSFTQGDGRVELEMVPTIEHGQPKSRFRGENGAWMVDNTSRDMRVFDDMKIHATLMPGEALAITCTDECRGIGGQFFGRNPVERTPQLLLLVRLQQTQADDRFQDRHLLEPVASTVN